MTSRERVFAVLSGQQPDHRSFIPITMMFAADVLGVTYLQCILDHHTMADAQIKTAEKFGLDQVSTIASTSEAVDLGAKFQCSMISHRESLSRKPYSQTSLR